MVGSANGVAEELTEKYFDILLSKLGEDDQLFHKGMEFCMKKNIHSHLCQFVMNTDMK